MRSYTAPDGTVWDLDRALVDGLGHRWLWDRAAFDEAVGPRLYSEALPELRMRLILMIHGCGLTQPPADGETREEQRTCPEAFRDVHPNASQAAPLASRSGVGMTVPRLLGLFALVAVAGTALAAFIGYDSLALCLAAAVAPAFARSTERAP